MSPFEPWDYRPDTEPRDQAHLVGYRVVATDGEVGTVMDSIHAPRHKALVIDAGAWVAGQRIVLPVGAVEKIHHTRRTIAVDRSVAEIRAAPPYEPPLGEAPRHLDKLADYYGRLYSGHDRYPSPEGPGQFEDPGVFGTDDGRGRFRRQG